MAFWILGHLVEVEAPDSTRCLTIRSAAAAAALADDRVRSLLVLFTPAARPLAEVARCSGMRLKDLHYQARKLVRLGLLCVVGERPRAGRPIKLYRAVADQFFVPDELLPNPFVRSLSVELDEVLLRSDFTPGHGTLFGVGPDGERYIRRVTEDGDMGEMFDLWLMLRLSRSDLAEFKDAIRAVMLEFENRSGPGQRPYLFRSTAVPRLQRNALP